MVKQPPKRVKHIPQRTCVGCRQTLAKQSLTRVVRTDTGVQIDLTGKLSGRGAYIHNQRSCWQAALKGKLANALKIDMTDEDRQKLMVFMQTLPETATQEEVLLAETSEE